jgi:hypothetical protein
MSRGQKVPRPLPRCETRVAIGRLGVITVQRQSNSSYGVLFSPLEGKQMMKGSEKRRLDHSIDKLFLDRWSPCALSGELIAQEELLVLFEAARWAPSSYNNHRLKNE